MGPTTTSQPTMPTMPPLTARLLFIILGVTASRLAAQTPADTVGLVRTVALAREGLASLPSLWNLDARDVDWIFARGDGTAWTTTRRSGRDSLVAITLPAGTTIANTAVTLEERRWAMVVLPLGGPEESRVRLLIHEAMHTQQPDHLPQPGGTEPGEGGDLLDGAEGRIWLFLELRALAAAITTTGDAQRAAARDALLFRARRDSLALPSERTRLDALDLAEGIPEYTAWRLAGSSAESLASRLMHASDRNVSWVRAVGYDTGPAYGFLLDQLAGSAWRDAHRQGARLPAILATVLGATPVTSRIDARAEIHGGVPLRHTELARVAARDRRIDSLRTRYVRGPVLRLVPAALQISFDPNGQFPLGADGTVMTNFRWTGTDGAELVARPGALVAANWSYVQVALGSTVLEPGTLAERREIVGDGWTLALPAGWVITRVGTRVEVRPAATGAQRPSAQPPSP